MTLLEYDFSGGYFYPESTGKPLLRYINLIKIPSTLGLFAMKGFFILCYEHYIPRLEGFIPCTGNKYYTPYRILPRVLTIQKIKSSKPNDLTSLFNYIKKQTLYQYWQGFVTETINESRTQR